MITSETEPVKPGRFHVLQYLSPGRNPGPTMKLVSRYLLKEFQTTGLPALGFVLFLLSLGQLFRLVELLVKKILPAFQVLEYWFWQLLALLPYAFSLAVLIAVTLIFSRLAQDREYLALKGAGISVGRIAAPLLMIGLLLSAGHLGLTGVIEPNALYQGKLLLERSRFNPQTSLIKPGSVVTEFPDIVIFIPRKDSQARVTIYQRDRDQVRTFSARRLRPVWRWGKLNLMLEDGVIQTYQPEKPETFQKLSFSTYLFPLPRNLPGFKAPKRKLIEETLAGLARLGSPAARVEIMRRTAFAFTPLLFILIGIPLGIVVHKNLWGVAAACGLVLGYYFAMSGLQALAGLKTGLAALFFLPDLCLLGAGLYFLGRLD